MAPFNFKSCNHFVASSDGTTLQVHDLTTNHMVQPHSIRKPHWNQVANINLISILEDDDEETEQISYDGLLFFDGYGRIEGNKALALLAQHLKRLRLFVNPEGYCFQESVELADYADFGIHYLRLNDLFSWPHHGVYLATTTIWGRSELKFHVPKPKRTSTADHRHHDHGVDNLQKKLEELKRLLKEKEEELEKADEAKDEELRKLRKEKDEEIKVLRKKKDEEKAKVRKTEEVLEKLKVEMEDVKEELQRILKLREQNGRVDIQSARRIEELQKQKDEELQKITQDKNDEIARIQKDSEEQAGSKMKKIIREKDEELQKITRDKNDEIARIKKDLEEQSFRLEKIIREKNEEMQKITREKNEELEKITQEKNDEIARVKKDMEEQDSKLQKITQEKNEELQKITREKNDEIARIKKDLEQSSKSSWAILPSVRYLPKSSEGERIHLTRRRKVPPEAFVYTELSYDFVSSNMPRIEAGLNVPNTAQFVDEESTGWPSPTSTHVYIGKNNRGFDKNNWWFAKTTHPEGGLTMLAYYDGNFFQFSFGPGRIIRLPFLKDATLGPYKPFFLLDVHSFGVKLAFMYRV